MHRLRCLLLAWSLLVVWLPLGAATVATAEASDLTPVERATPARTPVLVYEQWGAPLAGGGALATLLTVYSDGSVWWSEAGPAALGIEPCVDEYGRLDLDDCESIDISPPFLEGVPVVSPPPVFTPESVESPDLVGSTRRVRLPVEMVEALSRDLLALGAARLQGPQTSGIVLDETTTTVTFFHTRRRVAGRSPSGADATVARANSFSYVLPEGALAPIDQRIQGMIEWIRLLHPAS